MDDQRRNYRPQLLAIAPNKQLPILSFPWEIRNKILRELLYSPTPLRCRDLKVREEQVCRNHKLHPKILQTCSQLYEEGRAILWGANTIRIDLCLSLQVDRHWSVAGIPQASSHSSGKLVLRRVRSIFDETTKLHIFLDLRCYDPLVGKWGPDPQHLQIEVWPIRKLCERLLRKPNLEDCLIEITAIGAVFEKLGSEKRFLSDILKPFEVLRCHTVVINGLPTKFETKLANVMMIREPSWDLFLVAAALDQFVQEDYLCGNTSRDDFHICTARDNCEKRCARHTRIDASVGNCDLSRFLDERH